MLSQAHCHEDVKKGCEDLAIVVFAVAATTAAAAAAFVVVK